MKVHRQRFTAIVIIAALIAAILISSLVYGSAAAHGGGLGWIGAASVVGTQVVSGTGSFTNTGNTLGLEDSSNGRYTASSATSHGEWVWEYGGEFTWVNGTSRVKLHATFSNGGSQWCVIRLYRPDNSYWQIENGVCATRHTYIQGDGSQYNCPSSCVFDRVYLLTTHDSSGWYTDVDAMELKDVSLTTPTATATPSNTPSPTITPTPSSTPISSVGVWHVGNYIQDDSFEGINWFDDFFNPSWNYLGYFSRGSASGSLCGNNYGRLYTSSTIAGIETYSTQPFGVWQDFLWWGGDVYVTFAYRTSGSASVSAYLVDPFNQKVSIATGLQNVGGWKAYYGTVPGMVLGKYRLVFEGSTASAADYIDLDAISVSEQTYVHCQYIGIVLNSPPAALPQYSITGVVTESADIAPVEWMPAADNANVYGEGASQVLAVVAPVSDDVLDAVWGQAIDDAVAKSANWIDVLEMELNYPPGENLPGFADDFIYCNDLPICKARHVVQATTEHTLGISWIVSDLADNIVALENVETGQIIDVNAVLLGTDADGWYRYGGSVYVPTGRYRLRVGFSEAFTEPVYISKVCVGGAEFIISTGACDLLPGWHLSQENATLDAMAAQVTAYAGTTQTARANVTGTAAAAWAQTATPRAAVTQTALVAAGNATSQVKATQTQAWALTATPRYALTSTAWVSQFRATLTAQAGATATRRVQVATANAQGSINATNQAASLATAYAQATNSAQLTAIVYYQATLHANGTAQVNNQPTVQGYVTSAAATQYAAQTALAAEANGTSIANATAAAAAQAQINAQATLYAQQQATLLAQMTAIVNSNGTLQAQGTAVAQAQQTLIATLQMAATQQVLQLPPGQPMPEDMDPNLGCTRPDNPLNLAWWIDYEVCRVLWYFTWNQTNTQQVLTIATQVTNYEPYGTVLEVQTVLQDLNDAANQYDWADTGATGSADALPQVITDPNASSSTDGVITFIPLATEVPLFNADFDFDDQTLLYVLSTDCTLKLEANLGPYLTPPICFLISVLRSTGYLPFVRLLFDLGAIFLLVRYYWGWFLELAGERERAALREPTPGEQQTMPARAARRP